MILLTEHIVPHLITQRGDEMTRDPTRPAEPYRGRWAALAQLSQKSESIQFGQDNPYAVHSGRSVGSQTNATK